MTESDSAVAEHCCSTEQDHSIEYGHCTELGQWCCDVSCLASVLLLLVRMAAVEVEVYQVVEVYLEVEVHHCLEAMAADCHLWHYPGVAVAQLASLRSVQCAPCRYNVATCRVREQLLAAMPMGA